MNSATIYRGPSQLDGSPIRAVVTGLHRPSQNRKTGAMLQTWILADTRDPVAAIRDGTDAAVCGDCPHRGAGCYVNTSQAPLSVWRSNPPDALDLPALGAGRMVRLSAYGDPAAVPPAIWRALLERASGWTGYTHAWHYCDPVYKTWCMASCDHPDEATTARALGWRAFSIRFTPDTPGRHCPAQKTERVTCAQCGLCNGGAGPDIWVDPHGPLRAKRLQ